MYIVVNFNSFLLKYIRQSRKIFFLIERRVLKSLPDVKNNSGKNKEIYALAKAGIEGLTASRGLVEV